MGEYVAEENSRSLSPWRYLDSMILRSREDIKNEKKLLSEVHYSAGNYKIIVGLSAARGMVPSVKLINTVLNLSEEKVAVSLADFEWHEFLEIASNMIEDDAVVKTDSETENFTVSAVTLLGEKIINLVCNNTTLCFCSHDIESFVSIRHIVNYRLNLIKNLDFMTFYDNFLNYINTCDIQGNFFEIIKNICSLNMSEQAICMLELIHFNSKKVLDDFDRIQMCNI